VAVVAVVRRRWRRRLVSIVMVIGSVIVPMILLRSLLLHDGSVAPADSQHGGGQKNSC